MNDTENPAVSDTGLLQSMYAAVRRFWPTWEEWQVAVELYPSGAASPDL
jgi:hypothetical protein